MKLRIEDTNVRSRVKKAAVAAVPKAYGLHLTPNASQLHQNKERVRRLLDQSAFQYEVKSAVLILVAAILIAFGQDPEQRAGRFQHPVIAEIIWDAFFSHANALGCLYQEAFGSIPYQLFALTLTCVRSQ